LAHAAGDEVAPLSSPQGGPSPDGRARSVSSGDDHVFRTTDESPDRAAKVLTILDSAEREARRKSLAAAQMSEMVETLAEQAAVDAAEAAVDAAEDVAVDVEAAAKARAAQEAEDMLAMLDATEEQEAARTNAAMASKAAARDAARNASGMHSASPHRHHPNRSGAATVHTNANANAHANAHDDHLPPRAQTAPAAGAVGVGEQRSQRSEDLVWEQVQEQERSMKAAGAPGLHPELGESPYHQKLAAASGSSYARSNPRPSTTDGGGGGRGEKRRSKPKSPKYLSHPSQRAGNVPTPQEEYLARKRLEKIEKGIEQMMSDESRRHPPTWKIKHQKDVEKQELDRALAEALDVIEQKERALGIGQRLSFGISSGGAQGSGGARKVPRSLKGMSLTATAQFKAAVGAV